MIAILIAAAQPAAPPAWFSWLPIIGMVAIFYFLIIRPQMRQQKAHATRIASLKKGDQVVTAGGLVGKVVRVDETHVDLELGPNVRVKAVKTTIADIVSPVTGKPGGPAND